MSSAILYFIAILACILFLWKRIYALIFMLCILTIDFDAAFMLDIETQIKIIFLAISIIYMIIYGIRKEYIKTYIIFTAILILSLSVAHFTSDYSLVGALKSSMSFFLGLNFICTNFREDQKIKIEKCLMRLPIISLLIGILGGCFIIAKGRIGGASGATNLAFLTVNSIIAATGLYMKFRDNKYIFYCFASFAICFLTLTRGGILASGIVILSILPFFFRKMTPKKVGLVIVTICIGVAALFYSWDKLMSRMYSDGEVNTSGRSVAWEYIISLNDNPLRGQGYGKLTTMEFTGAYIDHFSAAHNEFVRSYFETGLIGMGLLIAIFVMIFKSVYKNRFINKVQFLCIVLAFTLYSFTDNTISNYIFWIPFMLNLNMLYQNNKFSIKSKNKCII